MKYVMYNIIVYLKKCRYLPILSELFRTHIGNFKHPFLKFIHKLVFNVWFHRSPLFALVTSTTATQTPPLRCREYTDIDAGTLKSFYFFNHRLFSKTKLLSFK
jgi:hypothetical protein